ncbi:3-demethylubiquinone-9 3-methyltransferase [Photobacterium marinum]|uniref:3-demethylubiquinone-9 3-methyltransferase n=1 Tax=Photobacterium marinum TaxID=1056511 RepID=L8JKC4_9GAMM|nr:methyltransferase domain-containing protein [Photobacterium marinum]ELR67882.1 3-demethylubiquinone-9 3-methyltransferase [Photobacterium marinum]
MEQFIKLYRDTAKGKCTTPDSYKGLPIHAHQGLHQRSLEIVNNNRILNNAEVLDIAAGSGAMSLRLIDNGAKVTSIDLVEENFRVNHPSCDFNKLDLNTNFSTSINKKFDVIIALEIIEHINNSRQFIKSCRELLKPGGLLIISTPNISSDYAIAELICKGTYPYFDNDHYYNGGHVNPISSWLVELLLKDHQLELIQFESFGKAQLRFWEWPKLYLTHKFVSVLRTEQTRPNGIINLFVITKST